MRKTIVVVGILALVSIWFFLQRQQEQAIRTHVVADYLGLADVMSSFMMEIAIAPKVTRPSDYSFQVLRQGNLAFQKKYQPYRKMRLYQHNRMEDFLASVEATVNNYRRLMQTSKQLNPGLWQQETKAMSQLFLHNATYCALAVGRDKKRLAISSKQRSNLLQLIYGTYGGMFLEYAKYPVKPPFLGHIILIRDSIQARKP